MQKLKFVLLLSVLLTGCEPWDCKYDETPAPGSGVDPARVCTYKATCPKLFYCPSFEASPGTAGFSPEQLTEISKAMDDWEISLAQSVDFNSAQNCNPIVLKSSSSSSQDFRDEAGADFDAYRGFTTGITAWINQTKTCGIFVFGATVRHELGHLLGLPHSTKGTDEMYYAYNEYRHGTIQTGDVELFELKHECCTGTLSGEEINEKKPR